MNEIIKKTKAIKTSLVVYRLASTAALAIPFLLWLDHTVNPMDYLRFNSPAGQIPYSFSKLFGLLAFSLLSMQIGLIFASKWGCLQQWKITRHETLGFIVFACITLHGGLFVAAKSIRGGHFAYETLIPSFSHGYYKLAVSLGILATTFFMIVLTSGLVRRSKKNNLSANLLHRSGLLGFILVLFHCIYIGSEI